MVDEYPAWLDYVTSGLAVVVFTGHASALLWLELELNPGLGLALGASGLATLGGVGLVAFAHRGVAATRRLLLLVGVQTTLVMVPVLTIAPTVGNSGFRAAFFACGLGIASVGVLLMGASLLGRKQWTPVDDAASETS